MLSYLFIVAGAILVLWHLAAPSCSYELWCSDPNPGYVGIGLLVIGAVIIALSVFCVI